MEISIRNVCRSCMSESSDLKSVFSTQNIIGNTTNLADMLMACASVQIKYDDGLPIVICVSCINKLNSAYIFKQRCEQTDVTLRKYLNNPNFECLTYGEIKIEELDVITEQFNTEKNDNKKTKSDNAFENSNDNDQSKVIFNKSGKICPTAFSLKTGSCKPLNQNSYSNNNRNTFFKSSAKRETKSDKLVLNNTRKIKAINSKSIIKCNVKDSNNCMDSQINLTCTICKRKFTSTRYLLKHKLTHKISEIFECEFCNKMLNSRHSLYQHKKIHTKSYQCKICEKKFKSAHGLEYHMKRHNGIKDFICPVDSCQKQFTIKQALTKHLTLHSAEKKHLCSECGKAYSTYDALKYHLKQHLGQRPFLCMHCGKTFIQSSHLKDHMWVHNGIKPYKCETCGNCYTSGHQLKKHLRRHCGKGVELNNSKIILKVNTSEDIK